MTYIDPRGKAFAHLDRLASWQAGSRPAPVTVEWDLTNVCSLGCQSCHFAHTHVGGPWSTKFRVKPDQYSDTGRMADPEIVEHGLSEMAAVGVRAIVWSGGGEPTLHPAFPAIIQAATRLGLEQGLYTLGGHVTQAMAERIGPCLSWAVVSLDACTAETYAAEKAVMPARFADACEGIKRLSATCPVVGVSFLLHADNWQDAPSMLALARTLGVTYATFRPTVETRMDQPGQVSGSRSWIAEALPSLWELAAESDVEIDPDRFAEYGAWTSHGYAACHGVKLLTQVTPDGRVWICPNRRGMPNSELGDLRRESFSAIWARHPGHFAVDGGCRVMCRLHLVNETIVPVFHQRAHEAFI